jgi:WD40 repeat protein
LANQNSLICTKVSECIGHSAPIYALENSISKGNVFSGSGDQFIAEWKIKNGLPEKFSIKTTATIYSICNIKGKEILLVGNAQGGLHIIDLHEKREVKYILAHQKDVFSIAFNPLTKHIYTIGGDGYLNIWDASNFELKIPIKISDAKLRSISINSSGKLLAVAVADGTIRLFETNFYNEIENINAHHLGASMVCFHPDKKRIITGGKDAMMNVWQINDTKLHLEQSIAAHNYAIYSGVFSPDYKYFATCSRDKTIKIWDGNSFDFLLRIDRKNFKAHTHSVNTLLWSKSTNLLISAGDDRIIMTWEIKNQIEYS